MKMKEMSELYVHEIQDLLSAETQILEALPKMEKSATDPKLSSAFSTHRKQTESQKQRLELLLESLGHSAGDETCRGMEGLIEEGAKLMKSIPGGAVLDAALIGAAQKIEHYEISGYGTARALAKSLGHEAHITILELTLQEESETDKKLTQIAVGDVNETASESDRAEYSAQKIQEKETQNMPRTMNEGSRRSSDDDRDYSRSQSSENRGRDEYGRFTSDDFNRGGNRGRYDDDDRGGRSSSNRSGGQSRYDDDDRGSSRSQSRYDDDDRRGSNARNQERDDQGRFVSDDDRGGSRSGSNNRGSNSGGRSRDDDDDRRGSNARYQDRDENGRFVSDDDRGGSRGSSNRGDSSGRGRDDDDDDRGGSRGSSNRGSNSGGRSRDDDDDRRGSNARYQDRD